MLIIDVTRSGGETFVCPFWIDELDDAFYEAMGEETDVSEDYGSSAESEIEPTEPKLYRVSDSTGEMEITEVATGRFEQEQLDISVRYKNYFYIATIDDKKKQGNNNK